MQKRRPNSLRHQGWHYGAAGHYFITICTYQRFCLFDTAEYREIAETVWQRIPTFKSVTVVKLDTWVVMPNHIHGILVIVNGYLADEPRPDKTISGSVGALVGAYKAAVTRTINNQRGETGTKVWQRGYYDRIIRNERGLTAVRKYIADNPRRWAEDRDNLDNLIQKMTYHPS